MKTPAFFGTEAGALTLVVVAGVVVVYFLGKRLAGAAGDAIHAAGVAIVEAAPTTAEVIQAAEATPYTTEWYLLQISKGIDSFFKPASGGSGASGFPLSDPAGVAPGRSDFDEWLSTQPLII